jgi:ABC-type oligopeptide transport system ATPase subunit
MKNKILQIKNLKVQFLLKQKLFSKAKYINAVNDISFDMNHGEILSIVGESGCGKSSLVKAIIGLNHITSGEVIFNSDQLLHKYNKSQWRSVYNNIQFIFQDPVSALDPRMTIFDIIKEPLTSYQSGLNSEQITSLVVDMMQKVGLSENQTNCYPSELSGGQCQRVAIARALVIKPKLLICDEVVSALDVSVKAQIINLLKDLQKDMNLSIVFISHDLSIVQHISDRVLVMNSGKVIEISDTDNLFNNPQHQYTKDLLANTQNHMMKRL